MNINMLKGSPVKAVLRFSVPLMIGNFFQLFYNLADSMIVGRFVNADALAAVGVTGPINSLLIGFAMGLTTGFAIPVAAAFGAGDKAKVRKYFGNAMFLTMLMSILITVLSVSLSRPLLRLIDTPAEIFEDANTYAVIIFSGTVFAMFYNVLSAMIRAVGDSRSPLIFLIASSIVNIVLDLVFVLLFHLAIVGVAVATVIGNAVSMVLCIWFVRHRHPELHTKKSDYKPDKAICRSLLSMGIPMALQLSITAIGSLILQGAVNSFGAHAVAAISVGSKAENIVNTVLSSLGVALSTFVAQNRGAKQYTRIFRSVRQIFLLDLTLSVVASMILWFLGKRIGTIFLKDSVEEILSLTDTYLKTLACFYMALAVLFIFRNLLQGLGYGYTSAIAGAAELCGRVLIAYVLASRFGFPAICLAGPAAWILADIPLVIIYFAKKRKLKQQFCAEEPAA